MLTRYLLLASPPAFCARAGRWLPWLWTLAAAGLAGGAVWGLAVAPPDYQQGEAYRIIYVHVPAAWLSLLAYLAMAAAGAVALIWHVKVAEAAVAECAALGASFTAVALVTGMLWGKPMWGAWWQWGDARLVSELVLLFLYLGVLGLHGAVAEPRRAARVAAVLALAGVVNVPIVHYSVEWWNTLHQGATVSKFSAPSAHPSMLWPLLFMGAMFALYFAAALLARVRAALLEREADRDWAAEFLRG